MLAYHSIQIYEKWHFHPESCVMFAFVHNPGRSPIFLPEFN